MDDDYTLTAADVAHHWDVTRETVCRHARAGRLKGIRPMGSWRFRWSDVWRAEGRAPSRTSEAAIAERTAPLLDKAAVARRLRCGVRTVERLVADDLPSLSLPGGAVRVVPAELHRWRAARAAARRRARDTANAGGPTDPRPEHEEAFASGRGLFDRRAAAAGASQTSEPSRTSVRKQ